VKIRLFLLRLLALTRKDQHEKEFEKELAAHLELAERDAIAAGRSPSEAARHARMQFGDIQRIRYEHRDARSLLWLEHAAREMRSAVSALRRSPGFSGTAVLTLALGIGSVTAIFSVVYGVLLKPLPFPDSDRLVALYHRAPGFGDTDGRAAQGAATYFTYRDHAQVFEDVGLWREDSVSISRSADPEPEQVMALWVTDGTLSLLGVRPEIGRLIRKEDDVPGAPNRVLLAHGFWQRRFGAAMDVVGQSVVVDGSPHEIVGVLPTSFRLLDMNPQVVLALRLDRATTRTGGLQFRGVGRLRPGVTLSQANADIARMIPLIVEQFPLMSGVTPDMWKNVGLAPNVRSFSETAVGEMSRPLWILLGTVGVILLLAWTNVANLLLVRADGRQREIAVRKALGASRRRIAAGLLSESLILALAGGAVGILFAQVCIALLRQVAPVALPRVDDIGIDWVILLVTLTTSVVTGLLFGLVPMPSDPALNVDALKAGGRSITDTPRRHRTRNALVVTQVALALLLLIVSGLMARTVVAMRQVEPGFVRPEEVQTFGITLTTSLIRDRQQVAPMFEQMSERLATVPSVTAVGLAGSIIMDGSRGWGPVFIEDRPVSGTPPMRKLRMIGPGYSETMGNMLIAGRAIRWSDIHQPTPVVWISENLAREYWGEPAKALGKRIGGLPGDWNEVVGVLGNERDRGLNQPPPTIVFWPMATARFVIRDMTFLVRSTRVRTPGFLRELQQAVWSVNPNVPLADVQTLDEIQSDSMAQTSFAMVMLTVAASVALMLAVVGVYGVVSYVAAERTHEVGIRMALGAQSRDVTRLFLRHGLGLTLIGIALGAGAAMFLTPVMSSLLYGVRPIDPATYAGVAITLGAATLLATYLPARRASRASPIIALRSRT
jgi:predicted permease